MENKSWIMRVFRLLLALGLIAMLSCCGKSEKVYRIGIDPSFAPIELQGQENYLLGFIEELLVEISKEAHLGFRRVWALQNTLVEGLENEEYDGVFASLAPYNFLQGKFCFSPVFFETGPVLLVRAKDSYNGLEDMAGKMVAVQSGDRSISAIQRYPKIFTKTYLLIPDALNQLDAGKVDGVVMDAFLARQYMKDLYAGKFKVGKPLEEEGLRLITLKKEEDRLMRIFNRSMKNLRNKGILQKLEKKWHLGG